MSRGFSICYSKLTWRSIDGSYKALKKYSGVMNVQGRNRGWILPDMHHRSLEDHAHLGKLIDHESTGFCTIRGA